MPDPALTQRILVPLDGSDIATVAVPYLRAMAMPTSEIVLVRVVSWSLPMYDITGRMPVYYQEEIEQAPRAEAEAYLQVVAVELEDISTNITRLTRVGMPTDEILQIGEERGVSLIIMATHGHGVLGRALIGSVADRVARASPVPVLLIHPEREAVPAAVDHTAAIRRLVVPLDGSERSRAALPVAAELGGHLGIPVHLVCAVPTAEQVFGSHGPIPTGAGFERLVFATPARQLTEREREYHRGYAAAASEQLERDAGHVRPGGIEVSTEVLIGETVPSIVSTLVSGDVVVMSSHGEGGIRRWQLGSVAEKLIHQAAAPVMLVPNPERRVLSPE
jgi:nucleotide-binding universal stress UspA family protein